MKKALYYGPLAFSCAVGVWHFFVPRMFGWYDYLPMEYENLIVGIDWTNFCFSALLAGVSLLLLLWGRRALAGNREAGELYWFLSAVWVFRSCLALFLEPWPLEPVPWAAIAQLVLSCAVTALMLLEAVLLRKARA